MQLAVAKSDVSPPDPLRESCGRRVLGDDPWVVEAATRGAHYGIKAYTAREWDPEINLYYYRARYYDPKVGRFLSEDPIPIHARAVEELNAYLYVRNRPVGARDPSGLHMVKLGPVSGYGYHMGCVSGHTHPNRDAYAESCGSGSKLPWECERDRDKCYQAAGGLGLVVGQVCFWACTSACKMPYFCRAVCTGAGAGTSQQRSATKCYRDYLKCKRGAQQCETCAGPGGA
jgi:RHS repeat-associated protein